MKNVIILFLLINLYGDHNHSEFSSNYGLSTEGNILAKFKDAKVVLSRWLEDMAGLHQGDVNIEFYDTSKPLYEDFKKNKVDMMILDLPFFFENREEIELNTNYMWTSSFNGKKFNQYYLLSNKSSNLKGFSNLNNKKVSIKEGDLTAEIWLKNNSYIKNKKDSHKLLSSIEYENKERTVILNLFFGKTDYAIVSKDSWETILDFNPALKNKIVVLKKSENIFFPFIGIFAKDINKRKLEFFSKLTNSVSDIKGGKRISEMLQFDKIEKINKEDLQELSIYYKEYFKLKNKYK